MNDDDIAPGTIFDVIIDQMAFPRGGGAITGKVLFCMVPNEAERDGAEITITTGVPWERETGLTEDARRALAKSAHLLLKAAAALSEDELLGFLEQGLFEGDLPELHRGRIRH